MFLHDKIIDVSFETSSQHFVVKGASFSMLSQIVLVVVPRITTKYVKEF